MFSYPAISNQSHVEYVSNKPVVSRRHVQRACHSSESINPLAARRTDIAQSSSRRLHEITTEENSPILFDFLFLEYSFSRDSFNLLVPTPCSTVAEAEWLRPTERSDLFAYPPDMTHLQLTTSNKFINGLLTSVSPYQNVSRPLSIVLTNESVSENPEAVSIGLDHLSKEPNQLVSKFVSNSSLTFLTLFSRNQSVITPIGSISLVSSKDLTDDNKRHHSEAFQGAKVQKGEVPEYPNDGLTLVGSSWMSQAEWVRRFLSNYFFQRLFNVDFRAPFQTWKSTNTTDSLDVHIPGVFPMLRDEDGHVLIGIASDWAAGTYESDLVQAAMMGTRTVPEIRADNSTELQSLKPLFDTSYTIHLGDCYYVGGTEEIEKSMLGKPVKGQSLRGVVWPAGSRGSLGLPGNHELYSGGIPYYHTLLPHMWVNNQSQKQEASFFALTHDDWFVLAIDTGYDSFKSRPNISLSGIITDNQEIDLPAPLIDWLVSLKLTEAPNVNKGIIILSHHQVASAFEKESGTTKFQQRIADLIGDASRRIVWLYGHEHRFSVYHFQQPVKVGQQTVPLAVYHRCVGNSGFPCEVTLLPSCPRKTGLQFYDDRIYQVEVDGNVSVPIGFNGFTRMHIVRADDNKHDKSEHPLSKLIIEYFTIRLEANELVSHDPVLLLRETFVNQKGSVRLESQSDVHPELTQVVIAEAADLNNQTEALL